MVGDWHGGEAAISGGGGEGGGVGGSPGKKKETIGEERTTGCNLIMYKHIGCKLKDSCVESWRASADLLIILAMFLIRHNRR